MSLADAIRELDENPPPPMSITTHPQSYALLSEGYARRDAEQEAAEPAA
jgi:hypothetical protein